MSLSLKLWMILIMLSKLINGGDFTLFLGLGKCCTALAMKGEAVIDLIVGVCQVSLI